MKLDDIKGKIADASTHKSREEKIWVLCLRFLDGQQHLSWDNTLQNWSATKEKSNSPTINLIQPLYRTLLSKLSAAYPGVAVMPASPSNEDIVKAKASEAALRYYWEHEKISTSVSKLLEWLLTCGNAAFFTYYDIDFDRVKTKVISPFDLFYEKGLMRLEESTWAALRFFYSKEDLKEVYPEHAEYIEDFATEQREASDEYANSFAIDATPPGKVETYEVYMKNGNYGILLGDKYLFKGKTPEGIFPVHHVKWTNIPNKLWGTSLIAPIIELQSYYNKARGQILENVELMANPKWLIPKSSQVAPNAISKRAGEKIFYNPAGGTPQQVPAAPIPSYVIDNIRQIQSEIMDVTGIHSTTLGKRSIGITSGKAINAMAAQDISSLQITQQGIEDACEKVAKDVLVLMKAHYTEDKMYSMLDNTGRVAFRAINSQQIVKNPEVFIQTGTLFQDSAADREARAIELFQAGLISKEDAVRDISFRTSNAFVLEEMEGISHASEILEAVIDGSLVEIFKTDDLASFLKVFGDFVKNPDYYMLDKERQDYIRDIVVSLSVALDPDATLTPEQAKEQMKVFPTISKEDPGAQMALAASGTQLQLEGDLLDKASKEANLREVNKLQNVETSMGEALSANSGAIR